MNPEKAEPPEFQAKEVYPVNRGGPEKREPLGGVVSLDSQASPVNPANLVFQGLAENQGGQVKVVAPEFLENRARWADPVILEPPEPLAILGSLGGVGCLVILEKVAFLDILGFTEPLEPPEPLELPVFQGGPERRASLGGR